MPARPNNLSVPDLTLFLPLVRNLTQRSPLDSDDKNMILALPRLVKSFETVTFPVRQGDIAKTCCLVLSGFVCRTRTTSTGSRQILSIHMKGDFVNLQNSFLNQADYNVQALTNTTLAFVPKHEITELVDKIPDIRQAIWRNILADASISREWLLNIGQRDAYTRVAHMICEVALRQSAAGMCNSMICDWPMTQEQFGDATGLTAVHINRMLKSLRDDGLINVAKRSINIMDWDGLKEAADFTEGYLHYSISNLFNNIIK